MKIGLKTKKSLSVVKNDKSDHADLTKSAFEWMKAVFVILILSEILCMTVIHINTASATINDNTQEYRVATISVMYTPTVNDFVVVRTTNETFIGCIIADEGEKINLGQGNKNRIDILIYDGRNFFSPEELEEEIGNMKIPESWCMVDTELTGQSKIRVARLVKKEQIAGKMSFVVYPFSLFGRNQYYFRK